MKVFAAILVGLLIAAAFAVTYEALGFAPEPALSEQDRLCAEASTNALLEFGKDPIAAGEWVERYRAMGCDVR